MALAYRSYGQFLGLPRVSLGLSVEVTKHSPIQWKDKSTHDKRSFSVAYYLPSDSR